MKNESSWQFSAALAKVDLPRIIDEAADVAAALGAVKVIIDVSSTESVAMVLADSDLSAAATLHRNAPAPDSLLTEETRLRRAPGGLMGGPSVAPASPKGIDAIMNGGAIVVFTCVNEQAADQLIAQLVDRVVVRVEVF